MTKESEPQLTHRQQLAIAEILVCPSLEEARRRLKAGKDTFYGWMKEPVFHEELERQRQAVVDQAFNRLKGGLTQAVDKLLELLQVEGEFGIQLRSAQTLLEHGIKAVELKELEDRVEAIEQAVHTQGGRNGLRGSDYSA